MTYRAFVSSTYIDLKEHRTYVIDALRRAGFDVDPMEDWTSDSDEPKTFSVERVDGCNLCILLVALRRGHVPDGETKSITEMEYARAIERGIDVLPFVLDEDAPWPRQFDELDSDPELRLWRDHIREHHGAPSFSTKPHTVDITSALARWLQKHSREQLLQAYRNHVAASHGSIRLLGLPNMQGGDRDLPIRDMFVKPKIAPRRIAPESPLNEWPTRTSLIQTLAEHRRLVILGDPGGGKSTLVSWLAWDLAASAPHRSDVSTALGSDFIPMPLILRELDLSHVKKWDDLMRAFAEHPHGRWLAPDGNLDTINRLLTSGRTFVMLDGIDEIGSRRVREHLRDAVHEGMRRYENCHWLLTSRIVGYDEVIFDHKEKRTADTTGDIAALRYIAPFDDGQIERFAHNWYDLREDDAHKAQQGASDLNKAIHADKTGTTLHLARIANLLTMMALVYRTRAHLPHGRSFLYNEITQAYLETIDVHRKLNDTPYTFAQKKQWLARVGFEMQQQRDREEEDNQGDEESGEIFASAEQVHQWVAAAMAEDGQERDETAAAAFVDHIARRSGLLLPRGEDRFAFIHLSFQEYFAACRLEQEITTLKWARGKPTAPGTSREDIEPYGNSVIWTETLILLFELLAANNDRDWLDEVSDCVFGDSFATLNEDDQETHALAVLLARLAVDPHAGFDPAKQNAAVDTCCAWEAAHLASEGGFFASGVCIALLSVEVGARTAMLERIVTAVDQANATELNLSGTSVSDVTPLSNLAKLQRLLLDGTSVSDVTPLSNLTKLQWLSLDGTSVSDVTPLSNLAKLQTLFLDGTPVSDVTPLSHLTKLQGLSLSGTSVSDVTPLSHLTKLQRLLLSGTSVSDDQIEKLKQKLPKCKIYY